MFDGEFETALHESVDIEGKSNLLRSILTAKENHVLSLQAFRKMSKRGQTLTKCLGDEEVTSHCYMKTRNIVAPFLGTLYSIDQKLNQFLRLA